MVIIYIYIILSYFYLDQAADDHDDDFQSTNGYQICLPKSSIFKFLGLMAFRCYYHKPNYSVTKSEFMRENGFTTGTAPFQSWHQIFILVAIYCSWMLQLIL